MATPSTKSKKAKKKANCIYITERTRYFHKDVPTIDTIAERGKIMRKLEEARQLATNDPDNTEAWKLEAKALTLLGQLEKWKGNHEEGDKYLTESAKLCRLHTFNKKAN
ncbi:hypothetical protein Ae201684P_011995 [Aphanomyces euteiches]|nr:hypothetical protein Ae201684P_011995 [Aphanomyces euteiches]